MITSNQIKSKALSRYYYFLSSIVIEENIFPLEIISNKSPGKDLEVYRREIEDLILHSNKQKKYGYTLEVNKTRTKYLGTQSLPQRIYFESENDFVGYLNKLNEVEGFKQAVNQTVVTFPVLKDWLYKSPKKIISKLSMWSDILKVCDYFKSNPKPNLYIRELPITVHTKFIENNKGIIRELLDVILDAKTINDVKQFESRFGLKYSEPMVRFKILDQKIANKSFSGVMDMAMPISNFKQLNLDVSKVIVVENKTSLYATLTLPDMYKTIAVFGQGFGVSNLKGIDWLKTKEILYWGDFDAHGFEILSQVRGYYQQTNSVLMDKHTFDMFFENDKGARSKITLLKNLTDSENELYQFILENNYRLEQEKIPNQYVIDFFKN